MAQAQNVDIIANNLANSDTLGFKKDAPTFKEYLSAVESEKGGAEVPRGSFKDKDFFPLDGRDQSFVVLDGTFTNFKQGALRVTQNPLDIALDGPGFLEVSTPSGVRYTRQGSLKVAMDGRLVTTDGNPVLASKPGGLAAPGELADAARFVNLRDRGTHFSISSSGELYAGDQLIAKLSVVEFQDVNKLRKTGGSLFESQPNSTLVTGPVRTQVRQGVLETSNVNPIEEMTNLIRANRIYESGLKAMKTYGEIMQRESNDIGKL